MNEDTIKRRIKRVRWRDLNDFPGVQISEEGDVRTWMRGKNRLLEPRRVAPYLHTGGRWAVKLTRDGKRVNRSLANLVLLAFRGDPPENAIRSIKGHAEVTFINGEITDVDLDNLRWATKT